MPFEANWRKQQGNGRVKHNTPYGTFEIVQFPLPAGRRPMRTCIQQKAFGMSDREKFAPRWWLLPGIITIVALAAVVIAAAAIVFCRRLFEGLPM